MVRLAKSQPTTTTSGTKWNRDGTRNNSSIVLYLGADYMANFSPGWIFSPPAGLKFCCDYMTSFNPGWNLKLGEKVRNHHLVSLKTQSLSMPKLTFEPGLKFRYDYMRFFWISARAENPSQVSQTGLKFSPCNRKRLFKKICSGGRSEISARLSGLKFQPGLKFAM